MAQKHDRRVLFICQHGAFRSRIAAAYFNASGLPGWTAISAGVTPQTEVSERLVPLMSGTGAEGFIDHEPPRALEETPASRTIAIDADVPGAELWRTTEEGTPTDEQVRDEIRDRVSSLDAELGRAPVL